MGGPTEERGDPQLSAGLARAWQAAAEEGGDDLTHGFHAYPARLPPRLVRVLLAELASPGDRILDPFVGSGTVLVEALAAGLTAAGVDVNPVSLRLAWARTRLWAEADLAALEAQGLALSEEAFRRARGKVRVELGWAARSQVSWYPPHVLLELQTLADLVETVEDPDLAELLRMAFSSILVKLSYQASETDGRRVERRVGRGTASRLFGDKVRLLVSGLRDLAAASPPSTPDVTLHLGDARQLAPFDDGSVDLIVTSPPYPGVYDYVSHQERRFAWLGEDPEGADALEIGARRDQAREEDEDEDGADAWAAWAADEAAILKQMRRVLRPGGLALVVMGDSVLDGRPYLPDVSMADSARAVGLAPVAIASQGRPVTHPAQGRAFRDLPRREHLMAFRAPLPGEEAPPARRDRRPRTPRRQR